MNRLTPLKNDCTKALERCIKNCEAVVLIYKYSLQMEECVRLCKVCIAAASECLDACESARLDRGIMMHACSEASKSCAAECSKFDLSECQNCAESCEECIEELSHRMA